MSEVSYKNSLNVEGQINTTMAKSASTAALYAAAAALGLAAGGVSALAHDQTVLAHDQSATGHKQAQAQVPPPTIGNVPVPFYSKATMPPVVRHTNGWQERVSISSQGHHSTRASASNGPPIRSNTCSRSSEKSQNGSPMIGDR